MSIKLLRVAAAVIIMAVAAVAVSCDPEDNNIDNTEIVPGTDQPGTDQPGTDQPGTDQPGTDQPGTDQPGTDQPGTDQPGTDQPGTDQPEEPAVRAVDLGLSVCWADRNGGAADPKEYGDYFAWGEVDTKKNFDWSNYAWMNAESKLTKYCTQEGWGTVVDNITTLDPDDDAARKAWGGDWRTPTKAEWKELRDVCNWTWETEGGVNGFKVTATNGASIFLPAAGYRYNSSLSSAGSDGNYWSRTLYTGYPNYARGLYFDSSGIYTDHVYNRFSGLSVRPVRSSQ